jgi:hypothetical protein
MKRFLTIVILVFALPLASFGQAVARPPVVASPGVAGVLPVDTSGNPTTTLNVSGSNVAGTLNAARLPSSVAAAIALAAAALPVSPLTGLVGGGVHNLDGLNVNTAPTALPNYATLLIVTFTGANIARLELNTDPVNGAQVIVPPDDAARSWRIRL